ncbi:MAG: CPBP family intramembrane metalloprotease, partial [bacterium]|nr:CPBP family intramembrane metalloprotease [bacterium]
MMFILIVAYLLLTPLQELIVRGGVQSSLQEFLSGKYRVLMAIVVSNLIFSMTHLHMSIGMGLFVLVYGIYWGFLYARQGHIIGVS